MAVLTSVCAWSTLIRRLSCVDADIHFLIRDCLKPYWAQADQIITYSHWTQTPLVSSLHCLLSFTSHSSSRYIGNTNKPNGGDNAFICCLPTANKTLGRSYGRSKLTPWMYESHGQQSLPHPQTQKISIWYSHYFLSHSDAISCVVSSPFYWLLATLVCRCVSNLFTQPHGLQIQLKKIQNMVDLVPLSMSTFSNKCRLVQTRPNWESWVKSC